MEIKEPNYFQQSLQRCTTAMKDKSLTSWALLCSKLCLASLTRHLCFRRIWWIMKTASFTVQGTKAIFHLRHCALASARGKWRKNSGDFFSSQVISAGEKGKKKTEREQQNNTANLVWEQVSEGGHCYALGACEQGFSVQGCTGRQGIQMGVCTVGFGGKNVSALEGLMP